MATGTYNAKEIPAREVIVDTFEVIDSRSGEVRELPLDILASDEKLNVLLNELWPGYFHR